MTKLFKIRNLLLTSLEVKRQYGTKAYVLKEDGREIEIDFLEKGEKYLIREKSSGRNYSIERIS